ncbi:MAG TPA: YebC/PmpR family DNA-binding transcriptional regulator [Patescibacteria group bacterium]|nr:YebC/PmpR family DNA-binding transcriptional regulator [Patescibacteria group bacterium]
MSGHNKWSKIKHIKAVQDSKKAAVFTKMARNITIAARNGGGDPETNFELRMAIDKAKSVNMPKDNIDRAIKKGTGELAGDSLEELYYEGMGPANTQFIVKSVTDNKNRSAANIKHLFNKYGGSFASVMWNFKQMGVIIVSGEELPGEGLEELELELIDAGAQDIRSEQEGWTIYTKPTELKQVSNVLDKQGIKMESADLEYIPQDSQELSEEDQEKVDKFIEELEDCEDVSDYYTNIV